MAKPKMTDDVRTFVVQSLAFFDTPSSVVASVREQYGIEITKQTVEGYDPTKRAGQGLSEKWRSLFHETRKAFLEDTADIAVSHRAVRLRSLQRMVENAERMKNYALAASLLEQAAKEMGDAYSNKRLHEHAGSNGVPLFPSLIQIVPVKSDGG